MDFKQIQLNKFDSSTIQRLISFVDNLEQKLSSVKTIHDKLNDLVSVVTQTHQTVLDELNLMKNILNQQNEQFNSKSLTNLNIEQQQQQQQRTSLLTQQSDRLSLCSASSCDSSTSSTINSANTKKNSNLKKVDSSFNRPKSPKSVTFSFDQEQIDEQPNEQITFIQQQEQDHQSNSSTKINSDLIPQLFHQHHNEITHKTNIGYKLGNALTHVRIHEIEPENGDYLRLLNVSNSDDYDLSDHFIQQNIACVPTSRFKFPSNTFIRAGQTVTIWCGVTRDIEPQPPHVFLWKEQRRWQTGPECVTVLAKPTGQAIAWARSSNRLKNEESSGDILFVHSKTTTPINQNSTSNTYQSRSRLSAFHYIGNCKSPFTHSPSNSIHPDCNPNSYNDLRSQMHLRGGVSQLLTRPKSSPFASHLGCKQDLISLNSLQKTKKQPSTIKT